MSKYRTTRKAIKEQFHNKVYFVPDGTMQIFNAVISPFAYTTRAEGWAADFYDFGDICINEGYDPTGKRVMHYEDTKPFIEAYHDIKSRYLPHEQEQKLIQNLLNDFIGTIRAKLGNG